jgi:hypothetical protein
MLSINQVAPRDCQPSWQAKQLQCIGNCEGAIVKQHRAARALQLDAADLAAIIVEALHFAAQLGLADDALNVCRDPL